jgi:NADPH:quinone reductase-like Zn-dependent oxidoreductase
MAHALGHPVFATAGSDAKCRACEALGARAINYKTEDFVERARAFTGGRGVDVILDMVAGHYVARELEALAEGGSVQGAAGGIQGIPSGGGSDLADLSQSGTSKSAKPFRIREGYPAVFTTATSGRQLVFAGNGEAAAGDALMRGAGWEGSAR